MGNQIQFTKNIDRKLGVNISFSGRIFGCETPIEIEVKESDGIGTLYQMGYENIKRQNEKVLAESILWTKHGSCFEIKDVYFFQERELIFQRKISVLKSNGHDMGFTSSFGLKDLQKTELDEYEVFVPGIWYRKNENVVKNAFASDLKDRYFYMRITRMALPYVELYHPGRKSFLVIRHLEPVPDTGMVEKNGGWLVDDSFCYTSLGIRNASGAEIRINYPGSEGEKNYIDRTTAWAKRSHPVRVGVLHRYQASVFGGDAEDSYEALRCVWRYYYEQKQPETEDIDLQKVYRDGINLLDVYCQRYNGIMGIPFWTTVPQGTVADISYQMGFVGQQTMCAYQLMRYGYRFKDQRKIEKAEEIIDFWVEKSMETSVVPRVWYNAFPATFKEEYPTYTRTVADGMEGILVCTLLKEFMGDSRKEWKKFCQSYGDWLVEHQNADGSWYRAYDSDGNPVHKGKYNTSNTIRFLVNLYWFTGDRSYQEAAERAGEYCLEFIYRPMQYVGGTADNDNTIDKEAGMIALYAFSSLYEMTGEQKYLEAAKGAADFCETWTYIWEFPVKPYKGNAVFDKVRMTGLSLIATGHSHADVMMGYMPFEYYRLWKWTGDSHYLEFFKFLNKNTHQTTDWKGNLEHAYPGLVEESGELALQYHNGLGKWLPWCTIAQIESLTRMEEKYGDMEGKTENKSQGGKKKMLYSYQSSWLGEECS